jgi:hypothetical protein
MAKFIKIFKRTETVETDQETRPIGVMNSIVLQQVVGTYLNDKDFDDLTDYFTENVFVSQTIEIDRTISFDIRNREEFLENAPLPDGTIINALSFEEGGRYTVIMGCDPSACNEEIKVGIFI